MLYEISEAQSHSEKELIIDTLEFESFPESCMDRLTSREVVDSSPCSKYLDLSIANMI